MDLRLVGRVAWRFRWLVAAGLVVAVAAGFLGAYRMSPDGIARRGTEQWASGATLLVTQPGAPETRAAFPVTIPPAASPGQSQTYTPVFGDPGYLTSLAGVYAKLAISNQVRTAVLGDRIGDGRISIEAEQLTNRRLESQPFLQITGIDMTAAGALEVRDRTITALKSLLAARQQASRTPPQSRVILEEVVSPKLGETGSAELLSGRSNTLPIALFLLISLSTFGLAFLLENLRPRTAAALGISPRGSGTPSSSGDAPIPAVAQEDLEATDALVEAYTWPEIARKSR